MGEDARAGRNQALYREVNERVREMNEAFDASLPTGEWICECANEECFETIDDWRVDLRVRQRGVLRDDRDDARGVRGGAGGGTRFFVKPDDAHVVPEAEIVVKGRERATGLSRKSAWQPRSQSGKTLVLRPSNPSRRNETTVFYRASKGRLSSMGRSVARAVETAVAFRDANEHLEAKADELGADSRRTPYLCECEDERCTNLISLTRGEYEDVRSHAKRFVMVTGHQDPEAHLVLEVPRFTVVEKVGEVGDLVAARDPRRAA
jgi:hypothetical protein